MLLCAYSYACCACSKVKELIYTYDGLYQVTAATMETGQEGFKICK